MTDSLNHHDDGADNVPGSDQLGAEIVSASEESQEPKYLLLLRKTPKGELEPELSSGAELAKHIAEKFNTASNDEVMAKVIKNIQQALNSDEPVAKAVTMLLTQVEARMVTQTDNYVEKVKGITQALEIMAESANRMSELPDGFGMSYEDVRKQLAMKHNTTVSLDDPILMLVTVCNAFLCELEQVHGKHNEAVTKIMATQSAKYIDGVKSTTEALSKTLAETSVETIKKIFDSHSTVLKQTQAEMIAHRVNTRWCAVIIGACALANVAVMAWNMWGK